MESKTIEICFTIQTSNYKSKNVNLFVQKTDLYDHVNSSESQSETR